MARIDGSTQLLAVIGHPVAHSFSPPMHNAAIAELDLNLCYVAFHVLPADLGAAVAGMRALQIRGMNVTIPHKEAVLAHLDAVSEEAGRIGAANTIERVDGRLIGHNTDVYGILKSLEVTAALSRLPARVSVLGASGAARGVVYGVATRPEVEEVWILNRTVDRARRLAEEMGRWSSARIEAGGLTEEAFHRAFGDGGLVINATSVGMHPDSDASPLGDGRSLHAGLVVYDIVFNPRETLLMKQARAAGTRACGGIEMLVYQGARAFEIWTGIAPPIDAMKRAIRA